MPRLTMCPRARTRTIRRRYLYAENFTPGFLLRYLGTRCSRAWGWEELTDNGLGIAFA
jgi:hypothetical protein